MKKSYLCALMGVGLMSLTGCAGMEAPCCDKMRNEYKPVVHFAFDKADLTSADKRILQEIPAKLENCPKMMIDIVGYTDDIGTPAYNMQLGKERAQSVQTYLMGLGVKGRQFTIMSHGEKDPVASNATEDGRAQNRRAVVHFK